MMDDAIMRLTIAAILAAMSAGCTPVTARPATQPAACSCPAQDIYIEGATAIYGSDTPDLLNIEGAGVISLYGVQP